MLRARRLVLARTTRDVCTVRRRCVAQLRPHATHPCCDPFQPSMLVPQPADLLPPTLPPSPPPGRRCWAQVLVLDAGHQVAATTNAGAPERQGAVELPSMMTAARTVPPPNYNRHFLPKPAKGPVNVQLRILLQHIYGVKQLEKAVQVGLRIFMLWYDPRLRYDADILPPGVGSIPVDPASVWIPHLEILNVVDKTVTHEGVSIYPNGYVFFLSRLKCDLTVKFQVKWFPFDRQAFLFEFGTSLGTDVRTAPRGPRTSACASLHTSLCTRNSAAHAAPHMVLLHTPLARATTTMTRATLATAQLGVGLGSRGHATASANLSHKRCGIHPPLRLPTYDSI